MDQKKRKIEDKILIANLYQKLQSKTYPKFVLYVLYKIVNICLDEEPCKYGNANRFAYYYY